MASASPAGLRLVAAEAGVHPSTASRALNPRTRHLVAAPVAERVREVAARLGYRPDAAAAALRTGRSRLVGALVPGIANPVFPPILAAAAAVLSAAHHALLLADPGDDAARAAEFVAELASRRVDGLLLATVARDADPALAACLARRIPVVLINRAGDGAPAVVSDDRAGMALAVEHLAGLGHRRIGHLAGPANLSTGQLRLDGFRTAMAAHGLPGDSAVETATAYTREAGAEAASRLLGQHPDLTALACANDLLALGAFDACRQAGRRVPEDISITGHNDMPLADLIEPPLTTIRIPHALMGQRAAELLLDILGGGHPAGVTLAPTLVVRASTAPARR
ncbi:LacI family DNA-binding transcriptional regulator [Roseomonas sp. BN140053]|uniref:LacI family DNA-binding transcriptional regulator n=1 Tax=Roseomonas sp. BN140053 TaxID=3391898 RepID=UPI0039E9D4E4